MSQIARSMTSVVIEGVSRSFGDVHAVRDVSLEIRDGEFFTLLGPSGCGKTTLLRMIAGFIVPRSGALGWLDTFALPARGRNDAAAYAWINFTMRPENAARVVKSVGSFSAAMNTAPLIDPRLKAQFAAAFPNNDLTHIHWYPAIPPGLEEMEGRVLDRVKAAN